MIVVPHNEGFAGPQVYVVFLVWQMMGGRQLRTGAELLLDDSFASSIRSQMYSGISVLSRSRPAVLCDTRASNCRQYVGMCSQIAQLSVSFGSRLRWSNEQGM